MKSKDHDSSLDYLDDDWESNEPEEEDDYPYIAFEWDEDDDDAECLDAEDASWIWMSNGKDEDYLFGYSDDELEDAL